MNPKPYTLNPSNFVIRLRRVKGIHTKVKALPKLPNIGHRICPNSAKLVQYWQHMAK